MSRPLNLLIAEDNPSDVELLIDTLSRAGFELNWKCVQTESDYVRSLHAGLDVIISDFVMPQFNGLKALVLLKQSGLDIPFILVSGTIGEETAVEIMRQGAADYVLKDRPARLGSAVRQACEQAAIRRAGERDKQALLHAEAKYRSLFENSVEGIFQATEDGRLVTANPAFARIIGYDSTEEMLAHVVFITDQLYANPAERARMLQLLKTQGFVRGFEIQLLRRDHQIIWARVSARVTTDSGRVCYDGSLEDITDRKRAESALIEQQELLRETGHIAKVGGWEFDPVTGAGYWTEEVARIHDLPLDHTPNKLEGISFYDAASRTRLEAALKLTVEKGIPYDLELELTTAKGVHKWIRTIGHPVLEQGKIVKVRGSFQDITERKQSEEALRQNERFVRAALNGLTAHIAILDEHGAILAVNDAWKAFADGNDFNSGNFGEGLNYLEVCEQVTGPGAEEAHATAAGIRDIMRGRRTLFEAEYPCHSPTDLRWFMVRVTPFPGDGPRRVVVAHENITPRKLQEKAMRDSEERFRQIAENISEVFWMTDVHTRQMLYISSAYEKIWGRSRHDVYANSLEWLEAVHPADRENVRRAALEKQAIGTYDETFRIVRPDGTVRWINARAYPIKDESGSVYRIAGVAADITEHRKLTAQFQQAQKMEAIGTMAGGIAHDFNNVLAGIVGFAELAKLKSTENPLALEYIDALLEGASRAAALVRQIMVFSRQQEQRRTMVQLREIVAEPLRLLRATIPSTIEFKLRLREDLPAVLADETQIHQIVMNLCTNAWHAMKDRTGRLTVELDQVTVDTRMAAADPNLRRGEYIRLTVSDTGHGMDRATQERIFEPFFTTKAPGEGTGLGLAAVHGIVKNHDGAITVTSRLGEGTSFQVYFPAQNTRTKRTASQPAETPRGNGERILFVDDEKPLVALGQAMLRELGYHVTAFTSSVAALEAVRATPLAFDLLITDLTMPTLTGTDLIQQIRMLRPDLPVILATGYTASLTPEKIKFFGIRELILKPPTMQSIGEAVRRALVSPV
ncbi:PAS domain S-box protein [Oleiharenicola lentus]|uniref:PAS domain S-box protein n=1 Tax=Oleiharenicola lentus TaxID=2508720 RepID=UPI003F67A7AB